MQPTYTSVHPKFKLNGVSLSFANLGEVSYSLIKEGEPYEQAIGQFLLDWIDKSPTLQVKTSGSTGKPKTITLQKQHMVNSALATGTFFNLHAGDKALLCLSCKFIAGKMMLVRAMVLGLQLEVVEPSSTPLMGLKKKSYDFCAMVPLQLQNSLAQLNQIKILIVGGAPVSKTLRQKVQIKKTRIYETYGMTETITHIAARKVNGIVSSTSTGLRTGFVRTPFKTLVNITVTKDERNCLVINAPNMATEPIITNDIVSIISETEFYWLGRYDNIINSGGVKLIPEQIESKLATILDGRFFVAGIADEKLGQKLVLVFEGKIDKPELLQKIGSLKVLEKFEIPKEIFLVPVFIETDNGKILRDKTIENIRK